MVIAIDGPAAAGKSTIAKELAKRLSATYLDTGALYRTITYLALEKGIDLDNEVSLAKIAQDVDIDFRSEFVDDKLVTRITVEGTDITSEIRSPEVSGNVSIVARAPMVRKSLLDMQRSFALKGDLVAEGRDVGTMIFPDAELKIFLVANVHERALRRVEDLKNAGYEVNDISLIEREIIKRDSIDSSREASPLIKAPDAKVVDTSKKTIDETVEEIMEMLKVKDG